MASELRISLPDSLLAWVNQQATAQGLSSSAEFVAIVLTKEQQRQWAEGVDRELLATLADGPSEPLTAEDWQMIQREGLAQINARRDQT